MEIASGSGLDVIEIDAASNRGINEMRELRESVRFRPARDRYKVFIVDEAHQNHQRSVYALLKTLEETARVGRVHAVHHGIAQDSATIQSRCQQFQFPFGGFAELMARMEWIAGQEGITADAEVLSVLAQAGEGSVRDSLSALDQAIACCGNTLRAAEVRSLLGMFSLDSAGGGRQDFWLRPDSQEGAKKMFEIVAELEANGRSLQHFSRELARYIRNLLVIRLAKVPTKLVSASDAEQHRLAEAGAPFTEEDLTRYLQLTLDLFSGFAEFPAAALPPGNGLASHWCTLENWQAIEEALAETRGQDARARGRGPARARHAGRHPDRRAVLRRLSLVRRHQREF